MLPGGVAPGPDTSEALEVQPQHPRPRESSPRGEKEAIVGK